jgi:hypothetical protein
MLPTVENLRRGRDEMTAFADKRRPARVAGAGGG